MADCIARIEDLDMCYTFGAKPWHGKGINRNGDSKPLEWDEVFKVLPFGYEVEVGDPVEFQGRTIKRKRAIYRTEAGVIIPLGITGTRWRPLQMKPFFEQIGVYCAETGSWIETALVLNDGEHVLVLVRNPQGFTLGVNDEVTSYGLWENHFDGESRDAVRDVNERVVCKNTWEIALSEKGAALMMVHSGNMEQKIRNAREIAVESSRMLSFSKEVAEASMQVSLDWDAPTTKRGTMSRIASPWEYWDDVMGKKDPATYSNAVFDRLDDSRQKTTLVNTATALRLAAHDQAKGNTGRTLWDAFNGFTYWSDHKSGPTTRTDVQRGIRALTGDGALKKARAFTLAAEMVGVSLKKRRG